MGRLWRLSVVLERPSVSNPVSAAADARGYQPGLRLTGRVVAGVGGDGMPCKGISITFLGVARARWKERQRRRSGGSDTKSSGGDTKSSGGDTKSSGGDTKSSGGDKKSSGGDKKSSGGDTKGFFSNHETYRGEEEYFKHTIHLYFGHYLSSGLHGFRFSFRLPKNLPSSVECTDGHIRYGATAAVHLSRDGGGGVRSARAAFNVVRPYDLERDPTAKLSIAGSAAAINGEKRNRLAGLFAACAAKSATALIPRRGLVPGEPVMLQIKSDGNKMRQNVVRLYQICTFHGVNARSGRTRSKSSKRLLCEGSVKAAAAENDDFESPFAIPPLLPPTSRGGDDDDDGGNVVRIKYAVECDVGPGLVIALPVTIGTIPALRPPQTARPPPHALQTQAQAAPPPPHDRHRGGPAGPRQTRDSALAVAAVVARLKDILGLKM